MIIIKRKLATFYIPLVFICCICILASCPFLYKIYQVFYESQTKKGLDILIIVSMLELALCCYTIYIFYKKVPIIIINKEIIEIGKDSFNKNQILNFDNSSKAKFYNFSNSEMPIIKLNLENKSIILFKEMYSNIIELEEAISK